MKKALALVLAAVLICASVFCFASCGEKKEGAVEDNATKTEIKGTLHMATNAEFEPYEYIKNKKIVGIDPEIAQAICEKLGYELVIDDMKFDSIITAVKSGKADFGMAGMTVTDERKKSVDFTDSYTNTTQVIIVKEDSDIATKKDIKDKHLGVQLGTTGDGIASENSSSIERYNNGADAVLALTQGKIDAVIIDREPARKFVEQNEGLKILDDTFDGEEYAICVKKDSVLTDELNDAIQELTEDGTIAKIINKYIK